jgi:N-acyl-D-aspartate/D-glutamate deacylase
MLVPGLRANVVAFDPTTVRDTATYEQPVAYPAGVEHVLVGGELVVSRGEPSPAQRPGRVITG